MTFTLGLPITADEIFAKVLLVSDDGHTKQVVTSPADAILDPGMIRGTGITNDLTIVSVESGVQCSHAGGCSLQIDAQGLASAVKSE